MLVSLYSAKGSPGATSCALALAATWPRDVVLIEADPSGSDLVYRCRSARGAPLESTPNVLGLVSAARADPSTSLSNWSQRLGCGVNLIAGVTTPSQTRGIGELWSALAAVVLGSEVDVIADLGRLRRESPVMALAEGASIRMPVLAASLESVMHTREMLKDVSTDANGRTVPLLLGTARTAPADCSDVDAVLIDAGLILAPAVPLPLDHPGLVSLQRGAGTASRMRSSHLVRGARSAASRILETAGSGVA